MSSIFIHHYLNNELYLAIFDFKYRNVRSKDSAMKSAEIKGMYSIKSNRFESFIYEN